MESYKKTKKINNSSWLQWIWLKISGFVYFDPLSAIVLSTKMGNFSGSGSNKTLLKSDKFFEHS